MINDKPFFPVAQDGIAFRRSIIKTFVFVFLYFLMFCLGLFLTWAKITHQVLDPGPDPKAVTWWGLLIGIAMILLAPLGIKQLVRSLWVKNRLVIASDRLQIIERLSGQDTVVLQIPYSNIADFKYETTKSERRIGIDLRNIADPETYAPKVKFEQNKKVQGRHICFSGGYRRGVKAIAAEMKQAYAKWAGN